VAYVRVKHGGTKRSKAGGALKSYEINKIYVEKASGKDTNRPCLQEMLNYVRQGIQFIFWSSLGLP